MIYPTSRKAVLTLAKPLAIPWSWRIPWNNHICLNLQLKHSTFRCWRLSSLLACILLISATAICCWLLVGFISYTFNLPAYARISGTAVLMASITSTSVESTSGSQISVEALSSKKWNDPLSQRTVLKALANLTLYLDFSSSRTSLF